MALYWPPRLKKGYHEIWEANLQPLVGANVPTFINVVTWGQKCNPKLVPRFFGL
jgi:hypothetical protein